MSLLQRLVSTIQTTLFPALEAELAAPLGAKGELFVTAAELLRPQAFIERFEWQGVGCPRQWRLALFLAFLAKAVWNFQTTRALLDRLAHDGTLRRLCGWDKAAEVPSEATFSRAFAEFARAGLPQQLHAALIQAHLGQKLLGHASHDATAIEAREKPAKKEKPAEKPKAKRGRRKKGEPAPPPPPPKRLAVQPGRRLAENLAELPAACDRGTKRDSKGAPLYWVGYKLHLSTVDGQVPVAAVLTSASLHDSQAAIPLMQMSGERVTTLYDLGDAAYDMPAIHGFSRSLGHEPIFDPAGRGKNQPPAPLAPARAVRYRERTAAERVNSDLLDNHGGRTVRVRGAAKVSAHLLLGVLVVAVKGLLRMLA